MRRAELGPPGMAGDSLSTDPQLTAESTCINIDGCRSTGLLTSSPAVVRWPTSHWIRTGPLSWPFQGPRRSGAAADLSLIASHAGGECCVCDIAPAFEVSQPTISHHLKTLREAGLLDCERRGTWVYYWVIPPALQRLSAVLAPEATAHLVAGRKCR